MSKTARRLGRGLESLVSDLRSKTSEPPGATDARARDDAPDSTHLPDTRVPATMVATHELNPNPFQPRDSTTAEDVTSLADSIRQSGMLQPIAARKIGGRYQIIAGERRWLAAKSLGMTHVPVIIRDATDEQMLELALIENIQREDLNAIDRARAYRELCTRFSMNPEDIAARLGEDRSTVINYLRLLDLPDSIQALVIRRQISMGHARCLLGITDQARRLRLAESIAQNDLSVRALEEIVRRERTRRGEAPPPETGRRALRSAHLIDLQQRFEDAVKTKVTIHEGKRKGTGRIVIEYYSLDDFDRIAAALGANLD